MDVIRLTPTNYTPDELIDGYISMLWAERYLETGDFEMKTSEVKKVKRLLPEGSFISTRNSDEVMLVESHNTKDGLLTLKGRSLDFFLGERTILGSYKKWKMPRMYSRLDAALVLLWQYFVNNTGSDVTRSGSVSGFRTTAVPNLVLTQTTQSPSAGPLQRRWLQQGQLDAHVIDLLKLSGLGIRTIRPPSSDALLIKVTTSGSSKGVISKTRVENVPQLRLDVYNGRDRSVNQESWAKVIFRLDSDDIENAEELGSIKNYKNVADVRSKLGNRTVYRRSSDSSKTGFNSRRLFVDAGEPEEGESNAEFISDLVNVGEEALSLHNRVSTFDTAVKPTASYQYGKNYFLGDKVTLVGDDEDRTMTVTEYILTENEEGENGYPGLLPMPVEDGASTSEEASS